MCFHVQSCKVAWEECLDFCSLVALTTGRPLPVSTERIFDAYIQYTLLFYLMSASRSPFSDMQLSDSMSFDVAAAVVMCLCVIEASNFLCNIALHKCCNSFFPDPLIWLSYSTCSLLLDVIWDLELWKLWNAATCSTAGSRDVDENNEDYPSQEVRSNNKGLNLALPRKRVPKVKLHTGMFQSDGLNTRSWASVWPEIQSFLVLHRMKRRQTVQIPFTKGGGNSAVIWRRFAS